MLEEEKFRDTISTVDSSGKRVWLFPTKPFGPFYEKRKVVSYVLLIILFALPWIKVNGSPLFLFNVLERKFILFGLLFGPQDFFLFALTMICGVIFIVLFTVVFGRLFCGWICPQTIFMEMVYRRIEYWIEGDSSAQKKLNKSSWTNEKIWKKGLKHIIFFVIAILVANTFLAYIIGSDSVLQIITEPISMHLSGFIAMVIFSFVFYGVFSFMREQVCIAICPYGRLQGVLMDNDTVVVAYDHVRGEPRGKKKKNASAEEIASSGDCVDCGLCVRVCPTGIDIRNGTQLECVNCTACIDACDHIMEKVDRPKGLIRYDSMNAITKHQRHWFTTRAKAYSALLTVLVICTSFLYMNRNDIDATLLRTPGVMFQKTDDGKIRNMYNYTLVNKTNETMNISFHTEGADIQYIGDKPIIDAEGKSEGVLFIVAEQSDITDRKTKFKVIIKNGDQELDQITTSFLGPIK